jgi:Flp pilus assembly protein TadD
MENTDLQVGIATPKKGSGTKRTNRALTAAVLVVVAVCFAILGIIGFLVVRQQGAVPDSVAERNIIRALAALEADKKSAEPRLVAAQAYFDAGDYDKAHEYADQALTLDTTWADAYNLKARAYEVTGDIGKAREMYQAAIDANQEGSTAALVAMARFERDAGAMDKAAAFLEEAARTAPTDATLHVELGALRAQSGDKDAARESYLQALAYIPAMPEAVAGLESLEYGPAIYDLAVIAFEQGDAAGAALKMRKATEISPDIAWLHVALGDFLALTGDSQEARAAYEKALSIDPHDTEAVEGLAELE